MSINAPFNQPPTQNIPLQVKYEDLTARYASHALLNTGNEELYIEFSSGVVVDRGAGGAVLPIHTRIAMTPAGVVRLWQLLGQAVQNFQVIQTTPPPAPTQPGNLILPTEPIVPPTPIVPPEPIVHSDEENS